MTVAVALAESDGSAEGRADEESEVVAPLTDLAADVDTVAVRLKCPLALDVAMDVCDLAVLWVTDTEEVVDRDTRPLVDTRGDGEDEPVGLGDRESDATGD